MGLAVGGSGPILAAVERPLVVVRSFRRYGGHGQRAGEAGRQHTVLQCGAKTGQTAAMDPGSHLWQYDA